MKKLCCGKILKNRLAVLLCTNKTGFNKIKLLVIGNSETLRRFKNEKRLPVNYKNDKFCFQLITAKLTEN